VIYARAVLLADGTSDEPLALHVAGLARKFGLDLDVVVPDFGRLDDPPGRTVRRRLERLLQIDDRFDVLIVHRDAERHAPPTRRREIAEACRAAGVAWPRIPIVPVRMTEAWLLLDELAIRLVAGKPSGREDLCLPPSSQAESTPDPKGALQDALQRASGLAGRRLREFKRDFPAHRRQLLERLDRDGPVRELGAWKSLEADVQAVARGLAVSV